MESVLSQLSSKAGEDAYVSTLADVVLHAELGRGHRKAKDNNQDVKPRRESVEVLTGLRANADKHVLLLGKPGSGKSTALKRLLREDAEKCLLNPELKIPVLLELRRLGANTSIESLLAKALSVPHYRVKPENIADLLDEYPFLLLLDGLNELPSGSELYDWRKDFSSVPMIFTSRELGVGSYFDIDTRLFMLPLTEEQTKDFIKNRLGNDLAFGMLQSLHGRVKELTDTPLLLDMLCDTYPTSENVAQNQGELFRQFTHDQYEKHKPKDTLIPRHNEFFDFRDEVLQEVAFYMMDADGDGKNLWLQVKRTDIEKRLEKYFREKNSSDVPRKVKQWLDDALNFHLLQRAADKDKVEFAHQLFQEYYAAEWLLRNLNELEDQQICAFYINPIKWTNALGMLFELLDSESDISRFRGLALDVGFPDDCFNGNIEVSPLVLLSSFAEDNRDNIDCMMGWSFNGIDEELLEAVNVIEINKGSNSLLQTMKAFLNDEHTKSIAIDIILNLDEVKYFFESCNEDVNLGCFEQEIVFELKKELDNPVGDLSLWRIKRFACILARIESRFSVSELVKLASSTSVDDSVFFYVKSLLINVENIEFVDLYVDLLKDEKRSIIGVKFLSRFGRLEHCSLLRNIPGGNDAVGLIQKRCGYYSYRWLEKSKQISRKLLNQYKEGSINYHITAQRIDHVGPMFNDLNKTGEISMTSSFNFHTSFNAGVVGNNHGTVYMNTLDTQDIQELRGFLQAWKNHQQTRVIENPENTGIEIAKVLQHQKPDLWEKIKYRLINGGVGASASLLGDLAVGEDPMKAAIKSCFAFIGGAATSP